MYQPLLISSEAPVSSQRKFLNEELLPKWREKMGNNVIDVGKSTTWDYRPAFPESVRFRTLDRDSSLSPGIVCDIETSSTDTEQEATGVLCNGVYEQCGDPTALEAGLRGLTAHGGILIFGAPGRMPFYGERDKWRLTAHGVMKYLRRWGILEIHQIDKDQYYFAVAKKL